MHHIWLVLWAPNFVPLVEYEKLAIVDFTVVGWTAENERGWKITDPRTIAKAKEELSQTLMAALENELQVEFDIVERRKLEAIQQEHRLAKDDSVQFGPSSDVWKLLKADRLLTGTVSFVMEVRQYKNKNLEMQTQTRTFHLSTSFKLIETGSGRLIAVGEEVVGTDSRRLRREGFSDETYLTPMCREMGTAIRERLNKAMKTRRDESKEN